MKVGDVVRVVKLLDVHYDKDRAGNYIAVRMEPAKYRWLDGEDLIKNKTKGVVTEIHPHPILDIPEFSYWVRWEDGNEDNEFYSGELVLVEKPELTPEQEKEMDENT